MHKLNQSLPVVLVAMSVALFAHSPAPAQSPAAPGPAGKPAPSSPDPAGRAALESDPAKAAAARKERCRLHPGTCTRGETPSKAPSKPAQ